MNYYIVKINLKYFNNIIRYIRIYKIIKKDNYYILYLDYDNYQKILKYKNIFEVEFIGYKGFIKYKNIFINNIIFFIIFFMGIIYLIFLSNIIFSIDIKSSNKDINNLLIHELNKYGIKKYNFVKSFKEKEKIKKNILDNNKNKLEWIEISRFGSKYVINVEERIINNEKIDNSPCDIVALKNSILLSIEAKNGFIVKKLNDYVKKGEVIVSGNIYHKDDIVDKVRADAIVFGETWYNVHVSYPFSYYEKIYTGNISKRLNFSFFKKNIIIGKKYKKEDIDEYKIIYNKFLPVKFSFEKVFEYVLIDDIYTIDEAYEESLKVAKSKLLKVLPKDSKILNQKKLKIIVNNSTIDVDIFFKVYENITDIRKIEE